MTLCASSSLALRVARRSGWLPRHRAVLALALGFGALGSFGAGAGAVESIRDDTMKTTHIIFALDTDQTVRVHSRTEANPPMIVLEFPGQQVAASLPERSVIQHGVVTEVRANYRSNRPTGSGRLLAAVEIVCSGAYRHRIRTQPGEILVEIDHPVGVTGDTLEIGLQGGTILSGLARPSISLRFQAMQEALMQASPTRWTWRATSATVEPPITPPAPKMSPLPSDSAKSPTGPFPPKQLALAMLVLIGAGGLTWWFSRRPWSFAGAFGPAAGARGATSMASTTADLVEQLVWRAFERQGYQLVRILEVDKPKGTLRVIAKDGVARGLFCVANGPFIEKATVDGVIRLIRQVALEQGFLISPGAFTVPAQRRAQDARMTLIGREELIELLNTGATGEYMVQQLNELRGELQSAQATAAQRTQELEALRRQRNEASWFLGEERAQRGKQDGDLTNLAQQLRDSQEATARANSEAVNLRKHLEESEWHLGEAKARIGELDAQIAVLQELLRSPEGSLQAERRQTPRKTVRDAMLEIRSGQNRLLFSGAAKDLSQLGVGFESERSCPVGRSVRLSLRLPGRKAPIATRGRLVWKQKDPKASQYRSGCRFVGLSEDDSRFIEQTLEAVPS